MNQISKCTQCGINHIVSETCEQAKLRLDGLMKGIEASKSGYAGILTNGNIVDRREYPLAKVIPKNSMFGIPKPKVLTQDEQRIADEAHFIREHDYRFMFGDRYVRDSGIIPIPPSDTEEDKKKKLKHIGTIGHVDNGKTTLSAAMAVATAEKKQFPILPDNVKDMVTLVGHDNPEVSKALTMLNSHPNVISTGAVHPKKNKVRKESNKKYSVRKKAKNGRTKKRRK